MDDDKEKYKGPGKFVTAIGRGAVEAIGGSTGGLVAGAAAGAAFGSGFGSLLIRSFDLPFSPSDRAVGSIAFAIVGAVSIGVIGAVHGLWKGAHDAGKGKDQFESLKTDIQHMKEKLSAVLNDNKATEIG